MRTARGHRCGGWRVVPVVVALLTMAACGTGTEASPPSAGPASQTTVLTAGPGTPIADGFVVAPDSRLVGVAFPQPTGGWAAVLSIDANPLRVVDAYLTQAAAHGLKTVLQCSADYPDGRSYRQDPLDDAHRPRPGAQAVSCTAETDNTHGDSWWYLVVHWGTLYDRTVSFTSAYMEYKPTRQYPAVAAGHAPRRMPSMIAWKKPTTAGVGQRFDGDFTGLNTGPRPGLHVVRGSQLAAPVADTGCASGGLAAVLKTSGGDDVMQAYAKQLADNEFPPSPSAAIPNSGGPTPMHGWSAGGGDVWLIPVTSHGTHWLLIQRCND